MLVPIRSSNPWEHKTRNLHFPQSNQIMKSTEKRSVLVFSFLSIQLHTASPLASDYQENTLYFCYHKKPRTSLQQTNCSLMPLLIDTHVCTGQTQLFLDSHISTSANAATRERKVTLLTPLSEPHFSSSIFSFGASKSSWTWNFFYKLPTADWTINPLSWVH